MTWKEIEGYEGNYEVSDTGLVRGIDRYVDAGNGNKRLAKGRILKLSVSNRGYLEVRLSNHGKDKSYLVHRLVAKSFIPEIEGKQLVNHRDGVKTNNLVDNLEWTDASGNAIHAYQAGLNSNQGCNHSLAVCVIDTITGELFCTEKAFCDFYGINYSSGRNALNGHQPFPKTIDLSKHNFEKYTC